MNELETLRHSCAHVLATAMLRIWPEAQFAAGPPVTQGFYYDVDLNHRVTPEDFARIEEEMQRVVKEKQIFERVAISREEAIAAGEKGRLAALGERATPSKFKLDILTGIPEGEEITFYQNGDFIDLCAGPHVADTGKIGAFKLTHVASAYYKGDENNPQLQRIYGIAFATQEELDRHFELVEEAKKRDHRKLGRELELFHIDESVGLGLVMWMPKGAVVRQELQNFIGDELRKQGLIGERKGVFPILDVVLADDAGKGPSRFVQLALADTDRRVGEG
ncbi:MAG: threonine--tRNA ligase, partial [Chthoniobacterales bacterium]